MESPTFLHTALHRNWAYHVFKHLSPGDAALLEQCLARDTVFTELAVVPLLRVVAGRMHTEAAKEGATLVPLGEAREGRITWATEIRLIAARLALTSRALAAKAAANKALWDAVEAGDLEAARAAHYRKGASVDLYGFEDTAFKLLEVSDIADVPESVDTEQNLSTLMVALNLGHQELANWLIEAGCDVNFSTPTGIFADGFSFGGVTPLMCCTTAAAVEACLAAGAEVNATATGYPGYEDIPYSCCSALTHAIHNCDMPNKEVCHALVRGGADVNYASHANSGGQGAPTDLKCYWMDVVASGDVAWAAELIDAHGADVDWPENSARQSYPGMDYGPDKMTAMKTALMLAIELGDRAMVELLLNRKANPNLSEALSSGNLKDQVSARQMEEWQDYEIDIPEEWRWAAPATPLSVAIASGGDVAMLKLLREHGAKDKYVPEPLPGADPYSHPRAARGVLKYMKLIVASAGSWATGPAADGPIDIDSEGAEAGGAAGGAAAVSTSSAPAMAAGGDGGAISSE